jgi:HlyD family secretion protein
VVDVLTADAAAIRPGAEVELDHGGNARPLAGRVRLVEPAAFTKVSALGVEEQRVNVVIDFVAAPEDWQNLGDAHRVDVRIVVEKRNDAVTVPLGALFRRDDSWAVFVLADGRARLRSVKVGPRGGQQAVVESGLEPSERVIVYPSDAVHDGGRVRARESASK